MPNLPSQIAHQAKVNSGTLLGNPHLATIPTLVVGGVIRFCRYHMLLEVALQRKRQRRIRGCKEPGRPRSTTLASAKKTRAESSCALLYSTDPFETSDESDADWDPCKIYGDEARRRLKSCQSETESDSQEECESSDTEANENQVAGESNDITSRHASTSIFYAHAKGTMMISTFVQTTFLSLLQNPEQEMFKKTRPRITFEGKI